MCTFADKLHSCPWCTIACRRITNTLGVPLQTSCKVVRGIPVQASCTDTLDVPSQTSRTYCPGVYRAERQCVLTSCPRPVPNLNLIRVSFSEVLLVKAALKPLLELLQQNVDLVEDSFALWCRSLCCAKEVERRSLRTIANVVQECQCGVVEVDVQHFAVLLSLQLHYGVKSSRLARNEMRCRGVSLGLAAF